MAFLNNKTEFNSLIDAGKQFQISIIRQEKNDLRWLITDKGLTRFKLWPRKQELMHYVYPKIVFLSLG